MLLALFLSVSIGTSTLMADDGVSVKGEKSQVTLIPTATQIYKGLGLWVAIKVKTDEGHYTTWLNGGGDPGTKLKWHLPSGASIQDIQFENPSFFIRTKIEDPENIPDDIDLTQIFGYKEGHTILAKVVFDTSFDLSSLSLGVDLEYPVCKDGCITENISLSSTVPIATDSGFYPNEDARELFDKALENWAQPFYGAVEMTVDEKTTEMLIKLPPDHVSKINFAYFYPYENGLYDYAAQPSKIILHEGFKLGFMRPEGAALPQDFGGRLFLRHYSGQQEWYNLSPSVTIAGKAASLGPVVASIDLPIWQAMLFALFGGLLLNLMPCVFPILSLKAFALVSAGGLSKSERKAEGWAYTAGILVSFAIVVGVLLAIRGGGELVGWGYQLQSPTFVALMAGLMVLVSLSLAGFFTFNLSFASAGDQLTHKKGTAGAFFTGLLATLVATPCTAPLMAPAIAFALSQSVPVIVLVFAMLGLGLALPFLLLCYSDRIAAKMPQPGPWMEKVKHGLAFPMMGTALWLLYIYSQQTDIISMFMLVAILLALSFIVWLRGQMGSKVIRHAMGVVAIALLLTPLGSLGSVAATGATDTLHGTAYNKELVADLRVSNTPVFLYFTAEWCMICKVNERFILMQDELLDLYKEKDVVFIKADMTNWGSNKELAALITSFGSAGVPTYVYFPTGSKDPIVLPNIPSVKLIKDTLNEKEA